MKKWLSLLLALTMLALMAAGCGRRGEDPQTEPTGDQTQEDAPASALELLQNVWSLFGENEQFPVVGGDPENMTDGGPGSFSLEDTDALSYTLAVPAEQIAKIDQAASLVHGMLSNNFTCGVFRLAEGADAAAFAQAMYDSVQGSQWMCGMPDRVIVAIVAEKYVLMAYGIEDALSLFQTKLTTAYPNARVVHDGAVTG